jgi:hypothetical protein
MSDETSIPSNEAEGLADEELAAAVGGWVPHPEPPGAKPGAGGLADEDLAGVVGGWVPHPEPPGAAPVDPGPDGG